MYDACRCYVFNQKYYKYFTLSNNILLTMSTCSRG